MTDGRIVKPVALFTVILAALVGLTFVIAVSSPSGPPDGESISGQSPPQYQPDAVDVPTDAEGGEIRIDTNQSGNRILIDTAHDNQLQESDIASVTEAVFDTNNEIDYGGPSNETFAESLEDYDGVIIAQPLESYAPDERDALEEYTENGGRVVFLAEPDQNRVSVGFVGGGVTTESFGAEKAAQQYGLRIGAEQLYNVDDDGNDNNFKAIRASPTDNATLADGVERISFDLAGYVATSEDDAVETEFTAASGTRSLETRQPGVYPTVVRNDNVVFVADSDIMTESEVYDADNNVFVGNLLEFLLGADDTGSDAGDDGMSEEDDSGDSSGNSTETPMG